MDAEVEEWARGPGAAWFFSRGASPSAAPKLARLYGYAVEAGLSPVVTSVYRSSADHFAKQARWDAGDRTGLRARPADASKHIRDSPSIGPAADAMDMPCRDKSEDTACAVIARDLGLRAGADFRTPDPGHYDVP